MVALSLFHVYLTPAFVLLTFIVNWIIKSCIDGEFRSSTYTKRIVTVLLSTIYPLTTMRKKNKVRKVYTIKDSLRELKYYYTLNIVIIVSTSVMYEALMTLSKEYQVANNKLQVPLNIWVHIMSPIFLLASILFRTLHHKTDSWKLLTGFTFGEALKKMFCDCSTPRPKSSFRVEEEEIVELQETKKEEEKTHSQHKEEEEEEIPQEIASLDKTDPRAGPSGQETKTPSQHKEEEEEEIPQEIARLDKTHPRAGPSGQEDVVIEVTEMLKHLRKKKEGNWKK